MSTTLARTSAEEALGISLPHRRMEDWRWTDLRRVLTKPYPHQAVAAETVDVERLLAASPFAKLVKNRVVFINGDFDEARSQTAGLALQIGVDAYVLKDEPVLNINQAVKPVGVALRFSGQIDAPVEIIHVATAGAARAMALRNHITVDAGASATVIETYMGEGDYLLSAVTEITVGEGAKLDRLKFDHDSASATHLSHVEWTLGAKAQLNDVTLTSGSKVNRQNGTCNFAGEHASARISGAYLLKDHQHADTALVINHAVPHCTSRETFKCVMDDQARGIFQGRVVVAKHAQKTDGKQSSHALLLSENAEFDAKPELEIYADDVVCGHGATAGDLNPDHLFYLRSRGIPDAEAKSLLIAAFVGEVFDLVADEEVKAALVAYAEQWLAR